MKNRARTAGKLSAVSRVARTAGALQIQQPPLTAEELREAAEESIAQECVERSEPSVTPEGER
jgi:hypothetical protein